MYFYVFYRSRLSPSQLQDAEGEYSLSEKMYLV